jgi:predicted nucleic acid-binding protein
VALVADTGALNALFDRLDKHHKAVRDAVMAESGAILVPVAILAELDYFLRTRLGQQAEERFLDGLLQGSFTLHPFTLEDAAECKRILIRYRDLDLGLAGASVIATAERTGVRRILTVDTRDFRAVQSSRGEPFELLPG